jgi:hypothetical protein
VAPWPGAARRPAGRGHPWLRLPAIGTSLILAPAAIRRGIVRAMARRRFWNFELQGIDFADAEQDGISGELVARQPDLRVPIADKLARLEQLLDQIARSWRLVTVGEAAAEAQRTPALPPTADRYYLSLGSEMLVEYHGSRRSC